MPSVRTNPPEKTESVTLLRGCVANGEGQKEGSTIMVSAQEAHILIGNGQAVRAEGAPKAAKAKKKAAKAKPPVDAER